MLPSHFCRRIGRPKTYSNSSWNVLSKDNTLRLNNKEVDELMNITQSGIQSLLWKSVVLSWANLGGETMGEQSLASNLSNNRDTQGHPCKLEGITKNIEITSSKYEDDSCKVGNAWGTWVVPAEKAVEERVVMCELLSSCCWLNRSGASCGEVRELRRGLGVLVLDVICNRAFLQLEMISLESYLDIRDIPLVTLWVKGWFWTALAAAEASVFIPCQCCCRDRTMRRD